MNHLVTIRIISYRIKMIPRRVISILKAFFYDFLLKCTDEMMPLSHTGREATLWLPVIIIWLLPKL